MPNTNRSSDHPEPEKRLFAFASETPFPRVEAELAGVRDELRTAQEQLRSAAADAARAQLEAAEQRARAERAEEHAGRLEQQLIDAAGAAAAAEGRFPHRGRRRAAELTATAAGGPAARSTR